MIEKLTSEQEQQLVKFRESCLQIGLCTDPIDRTKNQKYVDFIYKKYLELPSPEIMYVESPVDYLKTINRIHNEGKPIEEHEKIFHNVYWGNIDIYWIAFYLFPKRYLGIDYGDLNDDIELLFEYVQNIGFVFYHENICFICERPIEIHRNEEGKLHADLKPALRYKDGYCIHALNGVNMPEEIVMTPAKELDPMIILKEKNAEVRKEIISKIGMDRIFEVLKPRVIEKNDMYELLNFDIIDNRYRPYLKMLNPSTGSTHVEGVHPDCTTIKEALAWRNGTDIEPEILT